MIDVLDTNVISDVLNQRATTLANLASHQADTLCLCQPVDFEVRRGLQWRKSTRKLAAYVNHLLPQFQWVMLADRDWREAGQMWAATRSQGRQLADIDLLVAVVTIRLGGILVSADADFDVLPVVRHDWR